MKQEKNIETKAESQNGKSIKDVCANQNRLIYWIKSHRIDTRITPPWVVTERVEVRGMGGRVVDFICGKAPPGSARSPGAARGHPPENKAGPPGQADPASSPLSFGREGPGVSQRNNNESNVLNSISLTFRRLTDITDKHRMQFFKHTFFNFYKHLNFKIMKKQILILVLLLVAVFAGVNNSYGQTPGNAVVGSAPRGIGCVDDALHPLVGKEYSYIGNSTQSGAFSFWATKANDFISSLGTFPTQTTTTNMAGRLTVAGGDLLTATNYGAAGTAGLTDNVKLTWSDATLNGTTAAAPTFVVAHQQGTCADNLKVWSITPVIAFTVDIMNMTHGATPAPIAYNDAAENQCFDQVRGATYNAGTLDYDFGTQYLYWEVIAANFSVSYTPTFQISNLGNGQTATIEWSNLSTFAAATTTAPVAIANGTAVTSATAVTTNVTNTSAGISIFVRVTIKNNTFEGLAATNITLAVDGKNSVNVWDIVNNTTAAPTPLTCTAAIGADQNDAATQILNPRPTVTSTTVGNTPTYPNPALFIPTNATP